MRAALLLLLVAAPKAWATSRSTRTTTSTIITGTTTTTIYLSDNSQFAASTQTLVASAPTAMSTSDSLQQAVLNSTNYYRDKYLATPVTWNTTLASFAENYAKGCLWKHSGGPYGENLAAGYPSTTLSIQAWADEESSYNWAHQAFHESTGHFTQLVWQNTTAVGCGMVDCDSDTVKGQYLVCEYYPAGNVEGQFKWNVEKAGMNSDGELGVGAAVGSRGRIGTWMATLVVASVVMCLIW